MQVHSRFIKLRVGNVLACASSFRMTTEMIAALPYPLSCILNTGMLSCSLVGGHLFILLFRFASLRTLLLRDPAAEVQDPGGRSSSNVIDCMYLTSVRRIHAT